MSSTMPSTWFPRLCGTWPGAWGSSAWQPGLLFPGADVWLDLCRLHRGRAVEVLFQRILEPSGLFCWRPVDSYFRLVTGRRNPNLILLTLGLLGGRPDLGLLAVALWTAASSIFLAVRLIMGFLDRSSNGPLRSWFLDADPEAQNPTLAERCFSNTRS